ncbi:ATP-binding protein, partial [Reinekea blandensis]
VQKSIINRNFSIFAGIHRALKAMHEGDELRFPTEVPAEVADLVWEIEQTLQRSAKQLQRSRTAIGNLAHELKRPLQNLRWLSEHHHGEHSAELKLLYDQLQTLVIRELRRASISGTPTPGKRFQPNVDLPVLKTLLNRQHSRNVSLTLNVPDGAMPYDRDDMLELIGNLLDNAWRFAHTDIRLSIIQSSDQWILTVEDDGPGLAKDEYDVLSQRGVTRDESGSDHQGLGLHICQEVVASYSGRWSFQRSTLGGLAVRVELPVRQ